MARSTVCADTGNGATVTFASGISDPLKFRVIDPVEESVGDIDCSHLGTTGQQSLIPEDLTSPAELDLEWNWDTFDTPPTPGLQLGLTTVTYPQRTGEDTPASRAGTAYVSAVKHPRLENNVLQIGTMKVKFDNATPLAYTKST